MTTTNPTNPESAAGRLRRCQTEHVNAVYRDHPDGEVNAMSLDEGSVVDAYLRETDQTLVNEVFARSIAINEEGTHGEEIFSFMIGRSSAGKNYLTLYPNGWSLYLAHDDDIHNPTIGDVHTACRLFKVKMKDT